MATRNSQIKVEVNADTSGFNIDPAKKSLRDLQKDSAAAKAELAKLQLEFQESKNAAVQAGKAYDKVAGDDFKKRISAARTEISRLNAEVAKGVSQSVGDSGIGGKLSDGFGLISNAALAATAAIATVGASIAGLASKINSIANFQDVAEKIGDTAVNVSSLQRASDVSGVSLDTLAKASIKLTAALSKTDDEAKGAGQALAAIGLDLENFKKLSPVEQIDAVAQALNGFEDGASKTAVAVALFGKSGADLLPLLNDLASGYERQTVLTAEQIANADELTKQYAKLKSELSDVVTLTAADTAPFFTEILGIVRQTVEYFGALNEKGSAFGDIVNGAFFLIRETIKGVILIGSDLLFVFKGIATEIYGIGRQLVALAKGDLKGFSAISDAMKADAQKARAELDKFQKELQFGLTSKGRSASPTDPRLIGKTAAEETVGFKRKLNFSAAPEVKAAKAEAVKEVQLRADLANKESEAQKQSLNEFKFISEEYKRLYAENLVSIEAYYAQQEALVQKQRADDNAAFIARQEQLQAEKARLETGGADPKEVLKVEEALQKAITENQAKQLGYVTQLRSLQDAQVKDLQKYEASMRNISAEYLSQAGLAASAESVELRRLAIAEKYAAQIRQATAQGNEEALRRIENLKQFEQATAQLAARQAELQQTMVGNDVQQLDIQRQQQQGLISNIEAEQRLLELKRQQTEAQIAFNEAAIATGQIDGLNLSPQKLTELQNATAKLKVELETLTPAFVDLGTQVEVAFKDKIGGALGDVLTGTKSFKDAFKSLLASIAQDIIKSNISKLIAGVFGGGVGTNLSQAAYAGISGFADGGSVRGPGTSTSDSIPARLSDGEFVVKASSVQKYGVDFMHAINQGIAPAVRAFKNGGAVARQPVVPQRFATGGMVSPASASGSGDITIINNSSQPVQARKEVDPKTQLVSLFLEDLNRGGPISRGINGITGTGRKPAY